MASDVIDGIRDVSVTVIGPSGLPAKSTDDIVLKNVSASRAYQVKLEEFGVYNVTYVTTDLDGNDQAFLFKAEVVDAVKPLIVLDGQMPSKGTVGQRIAVPSAKALARAGLPVCEILMRNENSLKYLENELFGLDEEIENLDISFDITTFEGMHEYLKYNIPFYAGIVFYTQQNSFWKEYLIKIMERIK
jgi:hypothetical protein